MKEKCLEKLNAWFGDLKFEYIIIKETNDDCIFITISQSYKTDERNIEVYRVFRMDDGLEISQDLEYVVNLKSNTSILAAIEDIIKTYKKVK